MNEKLSCESAEMRLSTASVLVKKAADAVRTNKVPKRNLVWLELTGCSGNIISLMDGADPDLKTLVTSLSNLVFENSLMVTEGEKAMDKLFGVIGSDYILAVEGAVSTKDGGLYNVIGRWRGEDITAYKAVMMLGEKASHVIAVGTCASGGGVSAASPNPSECVPVSGVLRRKVIKLPGCPCNPDWFLGTLGYITLFGEPELDSMNRPLMFYSTLIHDICPRRPYFDSGVFAQTLGEDACMFKLGCRGPVTRVNCPLVKWNDHVNWPIGANAPCIGCAMFGFPDKMEPFISFGIT